MTETNWDVRWMEHAKVVAQWSKDPRRKVGCLIIDADQNQLSGGYNGFPRGIVDDDRLHNWDTKLKEIGEKYGITKDMARFILTKKNWKHV